MFKKPWFIISIIIILVIIAGGYFLNKNNAKSPYEFTVVQKGNLSQEVSVTGRVKPAQAVDLAFERSGKVARVNVKIGDKVSSGQVLAVLENGDLIAQISQARANVATQQANLEALQRGTRPEEIQIAETTVANAQKSLTDVQNTLANVKSKADSDLNSLYAGVGDTLNDAYVKADDAVNKQTDDLFTNDSSANPKLTFSTSSQKSSDSEWKRQIAGAEIAQFKQEIAALSSDKTALDLALIKADSHLKIIQDFLNTLSEAINESSGLTSTTVADYKYSVNAGRTNVSTASTNVNTKKQAIVTQRATNQSNITTAESAVNTAKNTLAAAQDQLALKRAGSTAEQINAQLAQVQSAQANLESAQAQLSKTIITSPMNGLVTKQDTKRGEIVAQNALIISVMSAAQFEIEANIPEADIAKVKLNNLARVTLDTYGNDVIFESKVVQIEPAETLIDGVATYKTTFQFTKEDERIKSGMTANIDIMTAQRTDALFIPQRAIIQKNGENFVLLEKTDNQVEETLVTVGLKSVEGNMEVLTGLKEGDKVVSYGEKIQ
jgi:HlyD family secretion protein